VRRAITQSKNSTSTTWEKGKVAKPCEKNNKTNMKKKTAKCEKSSMRNVTRTTTHTQ